MLPRGGWGGLRARLPDEEEQQSNSCVGPGGVRWVRHAPAMPVTHPPPSAQPPPHPPSAGGDGACSQLRPPPEAPPQALAPQAPPPFGGLAGWQLDPAHPLSPRQPQVPSDRHPDKGHPSASLRPVDWHPSQGLKPGWWATGPISTPLTSPSPQAPSPQCFSQPSPPRFVQFAPACTHADPAAVPPWVKPDPQLVLASAAALHSLHSSKRHENEPKEKKVTQNGLTVW